MFILYLAHSITWKIHLPLLPTNASYVEKAKFGIEEGNIRISDYVEK